MSLIGKTAEVRLRAFSPDAAEARDLLPEDGFPAVLACSVLAIFRLTELMELAAARLMAPSLNGQESSLSVQMKVVHLVAQTQGEVRAVATGRGRDGRLHHFHVQAFDETGLIASAEHTRAVVLPRRLLARARRRAGRLAMLLDV
jgi:predicted thioesterase